MKAFRLVLISHLEIERFTRWIFFNVIMYRAQLIEIIKVRISVCRAVKFTPPAIKRYQPDYIHVRHTLCN